MKSSISHRGSKARPGGLPPHSSLVMTLPEHLARPLDVLMIDNFDSFTWNLYQHLILLGADIVTRNQKRRYQYRCPSPPPDSGSYHLPWTRSPPYRLRLIPRCNPLLHGSRASPWCLYGFGMSRRRLWRGDQVYDTSLYERPGVCSDLFAPHPPVMQVKSCMES